MNPKQSNQIEPLLRTGKYNMAMRRTGTMVLIMAAVGLLLIAGCENSAQTGAAVGTLAGAGLGQAIGHHTGATVLGAAAGGITGYIIGNEEDKRQDRIEHMRMHQEMDYVTVYVTNSNGSYSRVGLRREGYGYIGPRGEWYDHLPTEDELRPVYGF